MRLRGLIEPISITLSKATDLVLDLINARLQEHLATDYVRDVGTEACTEIGEQQNRRGQLQRGSVRSGQVRLGKVRYGIGDCWGLVRQGRPRSGMHRHGQAWQGKDGSCNWRAEVRLSEASIGTAGQGKDRSFAMAWQASLSSGMDWSGKARYGKPLWWSGIHT